MLSALLGPGEMPRHLDALRFRWGFYLLDPFWMLDAIHAGFYLLNPF
jgi:hypothetical protein